MITEEDLKRYVKEKYTFNITIENNIIYYFPSEIYYPMTNRWLDFKSLYKNRIDSLDSSYVKSFKKELGIWDPSVRYIIEFPIIIEDRDYWDYLCELYNVPYSQRPRSSFFLDFFFPYTCPGLAVEIDGLQHEEQKEYDKARDKYIKDKFGINILRVDRFGNLNMPNTQELFHRDFLKYHSISKSQLPIEIDFLPLAYNIFITQYEDHLQFVENIIKYRKNNIISIKKSDWRRITGGRLYSTGKDFEVISDLVKYFYNSSINLK